MSLVDYAKYKPKKEVMKKEKSKNMTVKELIEKLQKLPPDIIISFCDDDDYYYGEVCWDLTQEEYEIGYSDQPYIFLTKMEEP